MKVLSFKTGCIILAILTTSMASADVVFSSDRSAYNFNAKNTSGADFKGYFTYNGVNYGVDQKEFDFSHAPSGLQRFATKQSLDGVPEKNVVYRFYNQTYSTVIGNIVQGDKSIEGRQFVKGVVGELTPSSALQASTSYHYDGVVFNHIADKEGTFAYNINVDAAGAASGSGSVSGITGNRAAAGGAFSIEGQLDKVSLNADASGNLAATTGNASLTLTDQNGTTDLADTKYTIGVYGPNANEVAGAMYTDPNSTAQPNQQLQNLVSGYGLAGELTNTTANK